MFYFYLTLYLISTVMSSLTYPAPSLIAGGVSMFVENSIYAIKVHFKRLGSRCFYDLFERCYFFFLNLYAYSKTKSRDIRG